MRLPLSSMAHTELSQLPLHCGGSSGGKTGWSPRLRRLCCEAGGEGGKASVGEGSCSWYAFSTNPPKSKPELLKVWDEGNDPKLVSMRGVRSGWPPNRAGREGVVLLLIGKISTIRSSHRYSSWFPKVCPQEALDLTSTYVIPAITVLPTTTAAAPAQTNTHT